MNFSDNGYTQVWRITMTRERASMRDVARAANVSVAAVSLVVRGEPGVGVETRERIWAAVEQVGYVLPRDVGNGREQAVSVLIEKDSMPAILDIFYGAIITGLQAEARRLGYHVLLHMFDRAVDN